MQILDRVRPRSEATTLRVIADDGYEAAFDLAEIRSNPDLLLTLDEERLRLVAPGYEGSFWVQRVTRLVLE